MHADPATAEGGAEDGEDDERDQEEEEGQAVTHRPQCRHVPGEHVHGNTGDVVGEGHVSVWVSPPGSIIQTELLRALVWCVE